MYDYMGRWVRKAVYVYNSGWPAEESPNKVEHFVYDNWNVILVLNGLDGEDPGTEPDNTLVRRYTWGLDLSGTITGMGGIGGLLAVEETATPGSPSYWFCYDGNGNVGQVIKASDQSVAARYEYDPYGNIIGPDDDADGDWSEHATAFALANPIRFSTKWFDAETHLGYWGYRYYSPRLGRWISRDPIGELGGVHLFAYSSNCPTGLADPLGLIYTQLFTIDTNHWIVHNPIHAIAAVQGGYSIILTILGTVTYFVGMILGTVIYFVGVMKSTV